MASDRDELIEDLRRLPLRAIVMFAARAARRVQPLYRPRDDADGRHRSAVEEAIAIAEHFANGIPASAAASAAVTAVAAIARSVASARGVTAAASAASFAASAAVTASFADNVAAAATVEAAAAAAFAAISTVYVTDSAVFDIRGAAASDLRKLLDLDLGGFPDLGAAIDPSPTGPLGPLWPDGEPEWLTDRPAEFPKLFGSGGASGGGSAAIATSDPTPDLVVVWDPEVLDGRRYAKLVGLLGDLSRAEGGLGVERIRSFGLGLKSRAGVRR